MKNKTGYAVLLLVMLQACKEKYDLPFKSPPTGYLVVEGVINTGPGSTNIQLSRTTSLSDSSTYLHIETGASVLVEGSDNSVFPLFEKVPGNYSADQLILNNALQYRLRIKTIGGKEYLSDFVQPKTTPPIDSLNWKRESDGVRIYVNTHDPQNQIKYYKWEFLETWEFHANYIPNIEYNITQSPGGTTITVGYKNIIDESLYKCWQSSGSTSLLTGSTAKLSQDVIFENPLTLIPNASWKLGVLYSINVKQYAISKNNYDFLEKMKKNTESVGSIFDPQPSELKGNIHCISNPLEPVIGYVDASSAETMRLFISNNQVPDWGYNKICDQYEFKNVPDSVKFAYSQGFIPTMPSRMGVPGIPYFFAVYDRSCADCTVLGTNNKPVYWP